MGNVASRPDEGAALFLRDQNRLSISSLVISGPRRLSAIHIFPNAYPATRVSAIRTAGDSTPIEFIQDPELPSNPASAPGFIIKLSNEDELNFTFTFIIRQAQPGSPTQQPVAAGVPSEANGSAADTLITGLTHVYAGTPRELENLVTREFHADPNLHKNSNVELVGDFTTGGSPSVSFEWTWKWKPPKNSEHKGGGWRNTCSFVEYDQRAHMLHTLASFSFWVTNVSPYLSQPNSPQPPFLLSAAPKIRVASSQSVESRISGAEIPEEPLSPRIVPQDATNNGSLAPPQPLPTATEPVKVDVTFPRPGEDVAATDDGPVFRATMKALEQKTGSMRTQMKKVIKKAEQAHAAQLEANDAIAAFIDALRDASSTNANAVQPAIEHYFDKIAREILAYERQNTHNLQKVVIEPLNKLYTLDIKQAEVKKRDFEEESKDYYAYVGKYLGQRHDSVKSKKLADSDTKYATKRKNFELKRFDYSSFMQDLSGGRKEQEVLSQLTRYADAQAKSFLAASQKIEVLLPQLEALSSEVQVADKEYQYQRREREEKRRLLEKSNASADPEPTLSIVGQGVPIPTPNGNSAMSDPDLNRADSTGSQLRMVPTGTSLGTAAVETLSRSPGSLSQSAVGSPPQPSKFKGIRDLEEKDPSIASNPEKHGAQRKEGLLWALNRPGSHVDPRAALNKQGWHKFWIVLDQGKLSEYSNWKQKLDLHMDPIDLRLASVREARNAERRFCFEVITPHFKRVYQATSEDDMNNWITSINNALQSAVEGRGMKDMPIVTPPSEPSSSLRRDIGSILTGKSPVIGAGHGHAHTPNTSSGIPSRRITVGARPGTHRAASTAFEENPDKLLQQLRDNDQGNCWCADCGSGTKVEWVSINIAIILCIECSGIHRSLGTHISKVRSLTLDITSFTPDIIELLMQVGNRVSNMVWEARLDPAFKLTVQATREQRLRFITTKYVDRAYIEPISATLSRYATPDETLVAGIKKNEIQQVIYALALGASPNAADKSRGTHCVFLALAAADPAHGGPFSPGMLPPGSAGSSTGAGSAAAAPSAEKTVTFPVAELLVQNGAEIPAQLPAFPLGRSAQAYIEMKRGRHAQMLSLSASNAGSGGGGGGGSSSAYGPGSSGGDVAARLEREREARLQKRVSAGGRLAKSPIPER